MSALRLRQPWMRPVLLSWVLTCIASLGLVQATHGQAQQQPGNDVFEQLTKAAESWAEQNLDDRVLEALKSTDQELVRQLFVEVERRLESNNLYDLGPLKDNARRLLPVLQQSKETRPYAEWLKQQLDYMEASEELRRQMQPQPPKRGAPANPPPPTAEAQRTVWDKRLEGRPLPPGARTYVPRLKPLFVAGGVPAELVWLAEVESSFNPEARSPSGAVGLFQFMPATARSLGLALSPRDERMDPERSARAAAKYLRYLYGKFGDWRLTFAAYNAGEGRVSTLLSQSRTRSFYAIASRLPAETQLYVPKIEATLKKREGLSLANLRLPTS
jgi:membrane-bound lytic murein transglycosylase D